MSQERRVLVGQEGVLRLPGLKLREQLGRHREEVLDEVEALVQLLLGYVADVGVGEVFGNRRGLLAGLGDEVLDELTDLRACGQHVVGQLVSGAQSGGE